MFILSQNDRLALPKLPFFKERKFLMKNNNYTVYSLFSDALFNDDFYLKTIFHSPYPFAKKIFYLKTAMFLFNDDFFSFFPPLKLLSVIEKFPVDEKKNLLLTNTESFFHTCNVYNHKNVVGLQEKGVGVTISWKIE